MTYPYPHISSVPVRLRKSDLSSYTIANADDTEAAGFNGSTIVLAVRNKGTAFAATATVQVKTSEDGGTNYSSPTAYALDLNGLAAEDVKSIEINGLPGQTWKVTNSSGKSLEMEYYVKPR